MSIKPAAKCFSRMYANSHSMTLKCVSREGQKGLAMLQQHFFSKILTFVFATLLLLSAAAQAATVTLGFEDVSPWSRINDGYAGLNWSGCGNGPTCFNAGQGGNFVAKSGNRFAYLNSGDPGDSRPSDGVLSALPGEVFDVAGGYFSANWRAGMSLEVVGMRDGSEIGRRLFPLGYRSMSYQTLALEAVDTVRFRPFGGARQGSPFFDWQSYAFSMDDVSVEIHQRAALELSSVDVDSVITPSTLAILAIGLALLLIVRGQGRKF